MAVHVLDNDADVDGNFDLETLEVISAPTHGGASVDRETGVITYTPDPDYFGEDRFEYIVFDDGAPLPVESGTATVRITVFEENDPPAFLQPIPSVLTKIRPVAIPVLVNDHDVDGELDVASLTIVSPALNGETSVDSETGLITYTPDPDFLRAGQFPLSGPRHRKPRARRIFRDGGDRLREQRQRSPQAGR